MTGILDGVVKFYPKSTKPTIFIKMGLSLVVAIYGFSLQGFSIQNVFVALLMSLVIYTTLTLTFWIHRLITKMLSGWGLVGNPIMIFLVGFLVKIMLPLVLAAFGLLWLGGVVGSFADKLPGLLKAVVMIVGLLAFAIPLVIELYILKNYDIIVTYR